VLALSSASRPAQELKTLRIGGISVLQLNFSNPASRKRVYLEHPPNDTLHIIEAIPDRLAPAGGMPPQQVPLSSRRAGDFYLHRT
jgi:hypothetical protein